MRSKHEYGFTLVELMVVIVILALLMAILLPSLSAANAVAKRTSCAHNLKQIGIAFASYLAHNDGALPPYGSSRDDRRRSYFLTNPTPDSPAIEDWTALWVDRALGDEAVLFCPGMTSPAHQFNTKQNPWPADSARTSYSRRFVTNAAGEAVTTLADLSASTAVAADLIVTRDHLDYQHKSGVNVLYGNWSVQFRSEVVRLFDEPPPAGADPAGNEALDAVWAGLDVRR